MRGRVNEEPSNASELKAEITKAAQELPLSMLPLAIDSWSARVAMCVEQGGMQFSYRLKMQHARPQAPPRHGNTEHEDAEQCPLEYEEAIQHVEQESDNEDSEDG